MPEHPDEMPEYWNRGKPYEKVKKEKKKSRDRSEGDTTEPIN
jgi:hypothetical protein